jgi:hypothetical protein
MKWFFKWLSSKIDETKYTDEDAPETVGSLSSNRATSKVRRGIATVRESDDFASEPIQFKMYKASGGWAVEFRRYDHRNDRVDTSLYVVNDEEELGNHISKIITMEALKR